MEEPDSPNSGHTRKVRDFWQKLLLLMVTAELQGSDDVFVSRVRVGSRKNAGVEESNINWRIDSFFRDGTKLKSDNNCFENHIPEYDRVRREIEEKKKKIFISPVARLIGCPQATNLNLPLYDKKGIDFPHRMETKKREYETLQGQWLFRIAVAFGFCPESPRNFLELPDSPLKEDYRDLLKFDSRRWTEELHFDPKRFDEWADNENESKENQLACDIWNAFAGQHTQGLWGLSFIEFKNNWCKRVSRNNEPELRAGVLVNDHHKPVTLYDTEREYRKARLDTNGQADRTATNSPSEVIPVDNGDSLFYLEWPQKASFPEDLDGFNRLMYTSGIDKFIGREDEIKLLHDFTGEPSSGGQVFNFRWMLLTGEMGAGKTMLAYHFSEDELDGGWYKGKLDFASLRAFHHSTKSTKREWRPRYPTFIVIDNVNCVPKEVGELLDAFTNQAVNFEKPVRLLLLARSANPTWTDDLLRVLGDNRPVIEEHNFGGDNIRGKKIESLSRDAIFKLMKQRIKVVRPRLDVPEKEYLLSKARDIDRLFETPRPLFAALAVEHYIQTKRMGQDLPEKFEVTAVLKDFIRRERDNIWCETITNDGERQRYEMGLAVATLAQGIKLRDLNKANFGSGYSWLEIPIPPNDDSGALAAFGCTGSYWPQWEPDIVGEYFISQKLMYAKLDKEERVALIEGAMLPGESQAVDTLWRLAQNFPERFKQLQLEDVARATTHERVLRSLIRLVGIMSNDILDSCDASKIFDTVFGREDWNTSRELRIEVLKATVNICNFSGDARNWDRVDEMLPRLDAVRKAVPQDEEIALYEAEATFNICTFSGDAGNWDRVDKMLSRLDAVREDFPQDKKIALEESMAAFNISRSALAAGDWRRVAEMMARFEALREREAFPQDQEFALHESMAAFNIVLFALKAGNWDRVDKMLSRLDAVRKDFHQDQEIALNEAKAAVNISKAAAAAGDWGLVTKMLSRLKALRKAFLQSQEIALEEVRAAFNIQAYAVVDGERGLVAEVLSRIDAVQKAFPHDQEIAREMAEVRYTHISGSRGDAYISKHRRKAVKPSDGTFTHQSGKVGRNEPCPCDSGKKFKQCCGQRSNFH